MHLPPAKPVVGRVGSNSLQGMAAPRPEGSKRKLECCHCGDRCEIGQELHWDANGLHGITFSIPEFYLSRILDYIFFLLVICRYKKRSPSVQAMWNHTYSGP